MTRLRPALTVAAVLFEVAHLAWERLHGGIATHHLLNRADLPGISNWWGLLLIPALCWWLAGRIEQRISSGATSGRAVAAGFLGALAYGAVLASAFAAQSPMLTAVFLALFAIGVVVPVYRAQCVLGFVLGMTFTFGAVLPTIIAAVLAAWSALMHMLFGALQRLVRRSRAPTA